MVIFFHTTLQEKVMGIIIMDHSMKYLWKIMITWSSITGNLRS